MELDEIRSEIEALADQDDLMLVDLVTARAGRRKLLRVLVDRPGRITVGECARLSREVQDLIDSLLPEQEAYVLEVSSPGIGRELRTPVDWKRCVGRKIEVQLEGGEVFVAELSDYDGSCLSFPDGRIVPTDLVLKAKEVI